PLTSSPRYLHDALPISSEELAELFGEPEVLKGYGRRNATLNAVAPTTSSSFILGQVCKSIEPFMSNYFVVDTAKAKKTMINEHRSEEHTSELQSRFDLV